MTDNDYSAFAALDEKKTSQVHRIRPPSRLEGAGEEMALVITIPIREIQQKAKPGGGQRKSLGFALGPIPFELPDNGGHYQITAAWCSLTAR